MELYILDISNLDDRYDDYGLDEYKVKNAYVIKIKYKVEIYGIKESRFWRNVIYKYEGD